jgi:hypothetical protein
MREIVEKKVLSENENAHQFCKRHAGRGADWRPADG